MENPDESVKVDHASPGQTAADIIMRVYPSVKIDSTLCKKLAGEAARREPTQRRREQKLNIERRSNVEALLAHVTGEIASEPCKNCRKGHGPWTQCVVYDGQMCGSCTNCWFNASGSRCTFRARIEAAVKELGVRIAEYDEFLRTPEGLVEQQADHQEHMVNHNPSGDISMSENSPGGALA
ncbi:hypothetical protein UVI_02037820 [Ustilaginoidea virens]|uniref:Uncharacterized protein n=1 Tax=Ustilaginoidea virens TaxID=1159556 RepID=A0A1B5KVU9_USTVR|nr:hypothetical protein UVI_02037820 [Ustilaginoidea virens]